MLVEGSDSIWTALHNPNGLVGSPVGDEDQLEFANFSDFGIDMQSAVEFMYVTDWDLKSDLPCVQLVPGSSKALGKSCESDQAALVCMCESPVAGREGLNICSRQCRSVYIELPVLQCEGRELGNPDSATHAGDATGIYAVNDTIG